MELQNGGHAKSTSSFKFDRHNTKPLELGMWNFVQIRYCLHINITNVLTIKIFKCYKLFKLTEYFVVMSVTFSYLWQPFYFRATSVNCHSHPTATEYNTNVALCQIWSQQNQAPLTSHSSYTMTTETNLPGALLPVSREPLHPLQNILLNHNLLQTLHTLNPHSFSGYGSKAQKA
jgi:hypothetical protein